MAAGLPPKPYVPPTAPAPPLPAGPAPQAYTQDPAAAHAAAWAAYYQSQGLTAQGQPQPAGYSAQAQPQAQAGPQQPGAANPYANYGYGAQAAQAHLGGPAQPGYRPPAQQGYQYPQQAAGYASPAPAPYQAPHQGYAQPQQPQGYVAPAQAWGQGPQQPQQGYRPPAQPYNGAPGNQPYFNGGPQQPYTPPHTGGQTPYRSSPGMNQNRPYAPQAQPMAPRSRPPMNQGPTPPHHPPAKRPRFDGPPNQGPTHLGGPRNASLPVRPGSIPNRPPSGPRTPLPPPPITRPPIHLGSGGPPPVFAPGGPRGITPSRGGRGGGRGGMVMNAPRGPSHMRRERQESQRQRSAKEQSPSKRDKKDKKKEKEKDNAKTTLTDFRIVGIEMKELGWSWGLVGEEAMNQVEEEEKVVEEEAKVAGNEAVKTEEAGQEEVPTEPTTTEDAKQETNGAEVEAETEVKAEVEAEVDSAEVKDEPTAEQADAPKEEPSTTELEDSEGKGKTGGKRKAQSPETDEGSSKKRSTYLLTHGKANEDTPSQESKNNQNRFRIYFESPPEADRIPQALRRNPYKRWRREDSALPATGGEKEGELAAIEETDQDTGAAPEEVTTEADVGLDSKDTSKDVPTSDAIPENQAATEVVVPTSASELVESTEPTPAENGHTEIDTQATEVAEQAVPEVSVETNVEVPATSAEEAPTMTEPPKEDELPIPAEQAAEVDQPTGESSAPAEVDPTSSAEAGPSSTAEVAAESSTAVADPTTTADVAVDSTAANDAVATSAAPASAEETADAIALSAENAASAYKSRTRRRSSVSSTDSRETLNAFQPEVTPSMNRLSILYEGSQRRMCFDAEVVERIEVWREEGRIEVIFTPPKPDEEENTLLPKGYLLEEYNQEDQRFAPVSKERLDEIYGTEEATDSIPPLHRHFIPLTKEDTTTEDNTSTGLRLNVYLNKKNPLSVPRWCRNNSADEWLSEQFGSKHSAWKAKLVVMDPDPPPTLASILENWSSSSNLSSSQKRNTFISTLLSDPHDLLEILLRLTRGDRNPPAPAPLANTIRADSPYATHQTHVSLAILAMYRLTTDYAVQAGVDLESVNEKIGDIIKSLPTNLIGRSLDGMFKEWDGRKK